MFQLFQGAKGRTKMSDDTKIWAGGCCCGAVRFEIGAEPVLLEFCHCQTCRRASGAPVMAWAGIPVAGFRFTEGEPGRFASSPGVTRGFCDRCGTSLTIFSEAFPDEIYVSTSALDDPDALAPEVHIWTSHKLGWFETADALPRYRRFRADEV
jgi:hypothetical protein